MGQFAGLVVIENDVGRTTIRLDGDRSKVTVGVNGPRVEHPVPGAVTIIEGQPPILTDRVSIDGASGTITINDTDGSSLVTLDGSESNGQFVVRDGSGREVLHFTSSNAHLFVGAAGNEGDIIVRDAEGREALKLDGEYAQLFVGARGNEGDIIVRDGSGRDVLSFSGEDAKLIIGATGHEGNLIVRDEDGDDVLHFDSANAQLFVGATGNEGDIIVRNDNGDEVIHLNGSNGDIILSNADAAEDFDLAVGAEATPGAVMVLTGDGTVRPCATAYDRKVIGVVAGAGAYRPAIVLDRRPGNEARRVSISVMGKVACRADAAYGVIEVGDLLTSSPTAGTAMRASETSQAFGAVIGKALTPLRAGADLVDMVIGLH